MKKQTQSDSIVSSNISSNAVCLTFFVFNLLIIVITLMLFFLHYLNKIVYLISHLIIFKEHLY
jgi:flagellar biogenesis protein FliO